MNDLILELTKRDTPTDLNEYVCLGHYDLARIREVPKGKRWSSFRYFKSPVKGTYSAPESIQRNYLISSGVEYGKRAKDSAFTFLMTISVNHNDPEKHTLQDYIAAFLERLKVNEEKTKSFYWRFYYPVARGDVIMLLNSNSFSDATYVLYKFVDGNKDILYSYTIPMVKYSFVKSGVPNTTTPLFDTPEIRLRATVKDYQSFYDFVNRIKVLNKEKTIRASFGTDDVQMDFSEYSDKKLRDYLLAVTSPKGQACLRDRAVFSAELDVPRVVDINDPRWYVDEKDKNAQKNHIHDKKGR